MEKELEKIKEMQEEALDNELEHLHNELEEVKKLYKSMGKIFSPYKTWSKYIITSYEEFETTFGEKATKNRKLYNGRIKTYFYLYFGEKPPKRLLKCLKSEFLLIRKLF